MPRRLLNHLTKTESLLLLLRSDSGLEWLVLNKVDRLLDGGGFGEQVEQIVQRLCGCCHGPVVGVWCCQGVPEHAGVGNGDKQAGMDGKEGAQWGLQRRGGRGREGTTTTTQPSRAAGVVSAKLRSSITTRCSCQWSPSWEEGVRERETVVMMMTAQATMTADPGGQAPAASLAGCT
jgi:hypothetical protein